MKQKSLLKLALVVVLIAAVGFLALNGLQIDKYRMKPVSEAISLGLDLRGGVSTEYRVTDTTMEDYEYLLDGTVSALRTRLTNAGFTEATVAIQGEDRILVEIPDVEDPEEVAAIIGTPAHLEFRDPDGNVVFEGNQITEAGAQWLDETATKAGVGFKLNKEAAQAFEDATREFIGQAISIYLDDELISAPVVENVIVGGQGVISGQYETTQESVEWAENLAMLIQSGALPLDIEETETRAISATLGIEAISGALLAGVVGLALILLFMLAVYRLPGIAADLALLIYILIVFYTMAILGTQLTLQGVAGILLGIGMAVDSNVVIFERFREELREGRTPMNAVKFGFRNAGRAVLDSNVTTLIAAVVLMIFGTGTIKGFATTLLISVLASLFTAVVVTRWLLMLICNLDIKNPKLYSRPFKAGSENKKFIGKTRICLAVSAAIIVVALVLQVAGLGMNLGIDFTGGSLLSYSVGEDFDTADVEKILLSAGYEGSQITKAAPSAESVQAQAEKAAADAAAVEAGEAHTHEDGTVHYGEHTEDAAAEEVEYLLDMDKSGIVADGLTDLQIRLNLVDESEGLEEAIAAAVLGELSDAQQLRYARLTNAALVEKDLDPAYSGGYIAEFEYDGEFDGAELTEVLNAALAEEYSVLNLVVLGSEADAEEQTEGNDGVYVDEENGGVVFSAVTANETEDDADASDLRVLVTIDDQASQVRSLLEEQMKAKYPNFSFVNIEHVSAVAGRDLLHNALMALLIAFVCMLAYIAIRFDVFSGLAALFGLLHDVLVMCAFMVFFGALFQVNSSFIAAVLTIVGYSINNTIIVFDRIRETAKKPGYAALPRREIVGLSVSNTLSRTINTSLTTLVTLVALYAFGVESIREFAFPLIVGMLAGTYSSVLLSGQVWAMWMEKYNARKAAKKA